MLEKEINKRMNNTPKYYKLLNQILSKNFEVHSISIPLL